MKVPALCLLAVLLAAAPAAAESSADSIQNSANNPLTPKAAIQLQDYVQPFLLGRPGHGANQGIVRAVLPFDIYGIDQLSRASLPVIANAWGPDGAVNGIGDLTVFDMSVFHFGAVKLGAGPLVVAPTATDPALGLRKWQLGAQSVISAPHPWGLTAALISYQQTWEGDSRTIVAQPVVFYNLEQGWYLRSTGIASFEVGDKKSSVLPVGLGLGHVSVLGNGTVVNAFIEPQYSVIQSGIGVPSFQIFAGLIIQFPNKKPSR
jgi:hypothetical protein